MRLAFLGDIQWNEKLPQIDPKILNRLKQCDYVFADLEGPIESSKNPIIKSGPSLNSSKEIVDFLTDLGVTHACCANNHIMDYGPKGLIDTINLLAGAGIECIGVFNEEKQSSYVILENRTEKIAVLNVCEDEFSTIDSTSGAYSILKVESLLDEVSRAGTLDRIIVVVHSGIENIPIPPEYLLDLNRWLITKNIDLVVGHHNHIYSVSEQIGTSFIHYGTGNFLIPMPEYYKLDPLCWKQGAILFFDSSDDIVIEESFFEYHNDMITEIDRKDMKALEMQIPIQDIKQYWEQYFDRNYKTLLFEFEPYNLDFLRGLYNRGLLPSFISRKRKALLLNLLRSQSNRYLRINALKKCVGY